MVDHKIIVSLTGRDGKKFTIIQTDTNMYGYLNEQGGGQTGHKFQDIFEYLEDTKGCVI